MPRLHVGYAWKPRGINVVYKARKSYEVKDKWLRHSKTSLDVEGSGLSWESPEFGLTINKVKSTRALVMFGGIW